MEEKLSTKKPAGKDRTCSATVFASRFSYFVLPDIFIPEITSFPFRRLRLSA